MMAKLTKEEMIRITTWVDSNCQFYGTYWGRKNVKHKEHPNFRIYYSFEEAILTKPPLSEDKR